MVAGGPVVDSPAPALEMRGVRKHFGAVRALDGVDLTVRAGEVHALIGENGAGKSTLMKVLAGALRPDAGTLALDGRPFAPEGPGAARDAGVAMIYQELNLAPELTIEDNVMLGRERARNGFALRGQARGSVEEALRFLGLEAVSPRTRVSTLGPGERQLVEIARALVGEVRVLVLDEPTSSLTRADVERLFEVVRRLRDRGVATVYISHFLEEVRSVCDRFTVLRDGRSVAEGEVATTSTEAIITEMVGRSLDEVYPKVERDRGEVALSIRGLRSGSGLRDASLELHRGEVLGISGLVGAGRTELLRALMGLDATSAGRITLLGLELPRSATPTARQRAGLGLLSEDRKGEGLALRLSIAFNATLSNLAPFRSGPLVGLGRRSAAAERWMERLAVKAPSSGVPAGNLSGGNQQKVALARLLHQDADVLLLDEPTRGVDVGAKVEIYRLIGEWAAAGKAVLVVSSYNPELLGICDRIAVMHRGVLGDPRPVADWDEQRLMNEAARGRDVENASA